MSEYLESINTKTKLKRAEVFLGEIQSEHFLVETHTKMALWHAQRAGELLIRVKETLAHGSFIYWIESNCAFSTRTAQLYMNLYRNKELIGKAQELAQLSSGALTISKAVEVITEGKRKERYEKSKSEEVISKWSMKSYSSELAEDYLSKARKLNKKVFEEAQEAYRLGLFSSEATELILKMNEVLVQRLKEFNVVLQEKKKNE